VSDVVRPPGGVAGGAVIGNVSLDPNQGGGLTALDLASGAKRWFAPGVPCAPPRPGCSPAQPGAVSAIEGAVFSGAMDGHIRAFSAVDGHLLWDFDTARTFTTVNGVAARGGSLDGAGRLSAAEWCSSIRVILVLAVRQEMSFSRSP
jgi:polyvinyl alcohol dehydrogenase (cytochrome)